MLSGVFAGLSGAYLAIEVNAQYHDGQTVGLGFIALAALILGNWQPLRLMTGALLFGFAQAIPLRLNDAPVIRILPIEFIQMIPYVLTIIVLAGFIGLSRAPKALGIPYRKES